MTRDVTWRLKAGYVLRAGANCEDGEAPHLQSGMSWALHCASATGMATWSQ